VKKDRAVELRISMLTPEPLPDITLHHPFCTKAVQNSTSLLLRALAAANV
jgi:hypothetical protein